jgi:hypothetical protein
MKIHEAKALLKILNRAIIDANNNSRFVRVQQLKAYKVKLKTKIHACKRELQQNS